MCICVHFVQMYAMYVQIFLEKWTRDLLEMEL